MSGTPTINLNSLALPQALSQTYVIAIQEQTKAISDLAQLLIKLQSGTKRDAEELKEGFEALEARQRASELAIDSLMQAARRVVLPASGGAPQQSQAESGNRELCVKMYGLCANIEASTLRHTQGALRHRISELEENLLLLSKVVIETDCPISADALNYWIQVGGLSREQEYLLRNYPLSEQCMRHYQNLTNRGNFKTYDENKERREIYDSLQKKLIRPQVLKAMVEHYRAEAQPKVGALVALVNAVMAEQPNKLVHLSILNRPLWFFDHETRPKFAPEIDLPVKPWWLYSHEESAKIDKSMNERQGKELLALRAPVKAALESNPEWQKLTEPLKTEYAYIAQFCLVMGMGIGKVEHLKKIIELNVSDPAKPLHVDDPNNLPEWTASKPWSFPHLFWSNEHGTKWPDSSLAKEENMNP